MREPQATPYNNVVKQLIALFYMEVRGGRHLFGPFVSWPIETQLAVVDVLYHAPRLPMPLLSSIAVCLNLDTGISTEVSRRVLDTIYHKIAKVCSKTYFDFVIGYARFIVVSLLWQRKFEFSCHGLILNPLFFFNNIKFQTFTH